MRLDEYCDLSQVSIKDEPSDAVVLAASYLEAKGFKFGVDFGYENAVSLAEEVYARGGIRQGMITRFMRG